MNEPRDATDCETNNAVDVGIAMARRIFEKRGNNYEIHLCEGELAGLLGAAYSARSETAEKETMRAARQVALEALNTTRSATATNEANPERLSSLELSEVKPDEQDGRSGEVDREGGGRIAPARGDAVGAGRAECGPRSTGREADRGGLKQEGGAGVVPPDDKDGEERLVRVLRAMADELPDQFFNQRGLMKMAADRLATLEAPRSSVATNKPFGYAFNGSMFRPDGLTDDQKERATPLYAGKAPLSATAANPDAERFKTLQRYGGTVVVDRGDGCKEVRLTLWWLDYDGGPISHENWIESFDRAAKLGEYVPEVKKP